MSLRGPLIFMVLFLLGDLSQAADIRYEGSALRDPFAEVAAKPQDESGASIDQKFRAMTVQGVMLSAKNPRAIINGKIYREGATLEGATILSIDKNGVTVRVQNKDLLIPHLKRTDKK